MKPFIDHTILAVRRAYMKSVIHELSTEEDIDNNPDYPDWWEELPTIDSDPLAGWVN